MPYCSNCRNYIPDGQTQCSHCGMTTERKNIPPVNPNPASPPPMPVQKKSFKTFWEGKDLTSTFSRTDIETHRWSALMCYLGPLILFPLFSCRRTGSKYAFFHLGQSISFIIFWFLFFLEASMLISLTEDSFFIIFSLAILIVELAYLVVCQLRALWACVVGRAVQYSIIGKLNISNLLYKRN